MFRIGYGFDVHRLVDGRKLILCGVELHHEFGLLGHSDADVAIHALMDAMLGALALGDIGRHFPDMDERYLNISSIILLKQVRSMIYQKGYKIGNCDITIMAQRPKISPYIEEMRNKLISVLHCDLSRVSIKATTTEGLGYVGRQEGVGASAVVLLERIAN
ncbi:MAG: 2-C-methyl-D-erythritol 2,4-cyclodiphosphate synthase [Lentisphaeria bacterium]|nr:2-C-methyl-D-erythritol 2,4-cyclodiphosphate synthase [Lentisphaeria bacterium]